MYTQCRGCGEVFVVEVDHLVRARGQVRCNLCGTVFDGMETLSVNKPHDDEDLLLHDFDNAPPLLTQIYTTAATADLLYESDDDCHENDDEDVEAALDDIIAEALETPEDEENAPAFVVSEQAISAVPFVAEKETSKPAQKASWLWSSLAVIMFLALLWQAQMTLASGQVTLPENAISDHVCEYLGCAEPFEPVDLNAISLVSRNIRPHPGRDQALIISASMINANEKNMVFPALEIKLSDLDGQIVAMRRFIAAEYVPDDLLQTGFVANTLIPINLEIVSPGDDAVAFEIGFVQP